MREEVKEAEPRCINCGKNEFRLMRTTDYQILAECIHCGEPHSLDAFDKNKTGEEAILSFWSPKMEEKKHS